MKSTTDYQNNFQYENGVLQFIAQPEGYIYKDATGYRYVYQYKDHLGNNRLSFMRNAGTVAIVKETNYYPFGLTQKGYNNLTTSLGSAGAKKYQYNGKELQDDYGLDLYDYGARFYDPAIARWTTIDPKAELDRRWNPYNYALDNPIQFIDPDGMWGVTVHVYNNRKEYGYGVAVVTDRHGNEVYRFKVRAQGTGGRNRYKTNADTPLGVYNIPKNKPWITVGSRASYGPNPRLNMVPVSGEIVKTGRSEIRIHGGRQEVYDSKTKTWSPVKNPQLKETHGCMRAYDKDMANFKNTTDNLEATDSKDTPGEVVVKADLEKVVSPGKDNYVNYNVTYEVPKKKQTWPDINNKKK